MIYAGTEASRLYTGSWIVRSWFHWPWGQPGEHETEPLSYEDATSWLYASAFAPLLVVDSDTGITHAVHVTRAVIEAA